MVRLSHSASLALAVLGLGGCGGAPSPPPAQPPSSAAPNQQVSRIVEQYWDEYLRRNPEYLPQGADTRFDAGYGYDISAQFLADSLSLERRYLAALLAVPRAQLDADSRLTYDIFRRQRESAIESFTYPSELLPVNPFRSLPLAFARRATGQAAILGTKDYERWRAGAAAYVRWTQQAIDNMREGMRRGYTIPRVLVEEMLPMLAALGEDAPGNLFYRRLPSISSSVTDAERKRLSDALSAVVRDQILPAYRTLHDFLRGEYLPRARTSVGLSDLLLGESWYAFLIKRETDMASSPASIHALGLAEVERLRGRLQLLLSESGLTGSEPGSLKTADELPGFYGEIKVEVAHALPVLFSEEPRADFSIQDVETFRQTTSPPLAYQRAASNAENAAVLYVNVGETALKAAAASVWFLREALPGHHFQMAVQQENPALPRFRRFGGDPAFVEGWGLYAASLGEDSGLYRDPEAKVAAVRSELECAAGLVIDSGLHSQGWSRQHAVDYLRALLSIDEATAGKQVDRDLALPAEALACTVGGREIQSLRARAQQALGERFDLRAFHAEILDGGAMPLDLLDAKLQRRPDGR
jgi:uncharacterized protein (DUF885 family)